LEQTADGNRRAHIFSSSVEYAPGADKFARIDAAAREQLAY
jgi:hypothetical protein